MVSDLSCFSRRPDKAGRSLVLAHTPDGPQGCQKENSLFALGCSCDNQTFL